MWKLIFLACLINIAFADFKHDCLKIHNELRAKHEAPPLVLDEDLQKEAQEQANRILNAADIVHNHTLKDYGENIAESDKKITSAREIVQEWYNEVKDYHFGAPDHSSDTGHFTQVVWISSRQLGCAVSSNDKKSVVVARYAPAGNVLGMFQANVKSGAENYITSKVLLNFVIFFISLNAKMFKTK